MSTGYSRRRQYVKTNRLGPAGRSLEILQCISLMLNRGVAISTNRQDSRREAKSSSNSLPSLFENLGKEVRISFTLIETDHVF
jgi:hypothetical protein